MMRLKVCVFLTAASAVGILLAAESSTQAPAKTAATPVKTATVAKAAAPAAKSAAPSQAAFDKAVKPLFDSTCSMCHSANLASGGLNVEQYSTVASLSSDRDEWDKIVRRLQAGEM